MKVDYDYKLRHEAPFLNNHSNEIRDYLLQLNPGRAIDIEQELDSIVANLKKREQKSQKTIFTFIDLFAGIGGMRLGFESIGGKCLLTSEIDKKALATYFCNFGDLVPEKHRDITQLSETIVPKHDILLGGFPCQAFSVAGERKGFKDTRGTLFFDIQRIIEAKRPKAIFLENVKGLLSHDSGKTFKTICDILEKKLKYKIFAKVLNTMEYGNLPQTRERIYLVGFDTTQLKHDIAFHFPKPIQLTQTIANLLEKKQNDKNLFYEKFDIHNLIDKQIIKHDTIYQWRRIYVRENKSKACPTLTANMGTGGHNVPLIREKSSNRIRKLSPRECANFQGFPSDFYIPKHIANSHLYKQFGNSVSVPVIGRIAKEIIAVLDQSNNLIQ